MWSDYFEPDFCDPDSPSYAGDEYLPLFGEKYRGQPGFVGDMWEEISKEPIGDVRNPSHMIPKLTYPESKYDKMRKIAIEIDEDERYDSYFNQPKVDKVHKVDKMYLPQSQKQKNIDENYVFTFGKYKGKTVAHVLYWDSQYIEWCNQNVLWFNY